MQTSVVVLAVSLLCLCVAEGEANSTQDHDNVRAVRELGHCKYNIYHLFQQQENRLKDTEKHLEHLKKELKGNQVAFGAALGDVGNVGPFHYEITLLYKKIFSNSGSYNPSTGIFTAPVRGVYYFSFSGHNQSTRPMGVKLMKNGVQMTTAYNHPGPAHAVTATNGMILQLEVGDQVYMRLFANTWIFDNIHSLSTFIGHLLYSL
ncbi:complement C1q tumor necrosis factor-related protein 6-like [Notolabrus celidotus]|uniref:complement C1q tumor necrosis factor-related protein 6-like n=1 Tax=Notolabrus celidotus TaxID=1203425 RepID=UPI001490405F|nr:complement C1q tumor necrosis factor-related protein 6-like [Notolabrus celidotus]